MREIRISGREAGQRLDKFLGKYLREAGKGFLYKMLRKKNITLNGGRADGSEKLAEGDTVRLFLSEETLEKFCGKVSGAGQAQWGAKLEILYEDSQVILVNKPAGMLSQQAEAGDVSLCEHLTSYLLASGQLTEAELAVFRPGVCNRLDRNTSGLVAAGKTIRGLQALSELFRQRSLDKYYLALVRGIGLKARRLEGYLRKDAASNTVAVSARPAEGSSFICTAYEPVEEGEGATLLRVHLITGKTHQIRAHLASIGHPILGDRKYGEPRPEFPRQMLHAWELVFPNPLPGLPQLAGRRFQAPLPADFRKALQKLGMPAIPEQMP